MSNLDVTEHETEMECLMRFSDLQITKPLKQTEVLCSSRIHNNTALCSHMFDCYSINLIFPQPMNIKCGPSSSAGIATGCGMDGQEIELWWGRDFPHVQTNNKAHQASCKLGTGTFRG